MTLKRLENLANGRAWAVILMALVAAFLAAGCQAPDRRQNWSPTEHSTPNQSLQLKEGDQLNLSFLGATNMNTAVRIRRDGMINLPLVGEVAASGKTPTQLQDDLIELYQSQLQVADVSITLNSPSVVYVTGKVFTPGKYAVDRPLTVLEAIMEAGGFDDRDQYYTADVQRVLVIRHEAGRRIEYRVNLQSVLRGGPSDPFYLKPFDIVYVPKARQSGIRF